MPRSLVAHNINMGCPRELIVDSESQMLMPANLREGISEFSVQGEGQ